MSDPPLFFLYSVHFTRKIKFLLGQTMWA